MVLGRSRQHLPSIATSQFETALASVRPDIEMSRVGQCHWEDGH